MKAIKLKDQALSDLEKRVEQFNALQLPGQPTSMHVGTYSLINDLWRELKHRMEML